MICSMLYIYIYIYIYHPIFSKVATYDSMEGQFIRVAKEAIVVMKQKRNKSFA